MHKSNSRDRVRTGADAAFAKAMARSEFGRFYCSDSDMREVRRSMSRAQGREKAEPGTNGRTVETVEAKPAKSKGPASRPAPRLRERREELAQGFARLREAIKPQG